MSKETKVYEKKELVVSNPTVDDIKNTYLFWMWLVYDNPDPDWMKILEEKIFLAELLSGHDDERLQKLLSETGMSLPELKSVHNHLIINLKSLQAKKNSTH